VYGGLKHGHCQSWVRGEGSRERSWLHATHARTSRRIVSSNQILELDNHGFVDIYCLVVPCLCGVVVVAGCVFVWLYAAL
jgi:hypothetical protein